MIERIIDIKCDICGKKIDHTKCFFQIKIESGRYVSGLCVGSDQSLEKTYQDVCTDCGEYIEDVINKIKNN